MALPVLDGNQSATTLSSVVTGGEHIVAHSVVSLGTTAIANITSAVSGVNIGGTVTANINGTPAVTIPQLNRVIQSVATDGVADTNLNFVKIGGHQDGSNQTAHIVHVSAGGAMKVDATDSSVTFGAVRGTVTIGNFPSTQTIAGTVTANVPILSPGNSPNSIVSDEGGARLSFGLQIGYDDTVNDSFKLVGDTNPLPISGTVTVGNSVTIGSIPAISGTVTANVLGYSDNEASYQPIPVVPWDENVSSGRAVVVKVQQEGMPLLGISGTVTAAAPNGSLTTRFGTPTTANTAFATSAVTNANRKYLLIQNVTTGSNVITVGIGFTPTTTQGIQLTAGAGITFESSYIPTGQIFVLSSVTASNFTILEA